MSEETLRQEARTFGRALAGRAPGAYVEERYLAFHRLHPDGRPAAMDGLLLGLARAHPLLTRIADAYSARLRRRSPLRRKLVLALALVECAPETYRAVERPGPGGAALGLPRLVVRGLAEVALLVVGIVLLLPIHAILAVTTADPGQDRQSGRDGP